MKKLLIGILFLNPVFLGANEAEMKWDLKDKQVETFSMIPPVQSGEKFAPGGMLFDLSGKGKDVIVSLCGPALQVESGADVPLESLGALSVERLDKTGWFQSVSQVIDGKVVLRVSTPGVRELLESEIKDFQEKYSCSNS